MTDYPQGSFNQAYNPEPPKKDNKKVIIIVIVVVVILCCCCAVTAGLLWTYGDQIAKSLGLY